MSEMPVSPRIPIPAGLLTAQGTADPYLAFDPRIRAGRDRLSALTKRSGALDPITHELVRLRNAHLQGCHT
jgi:hypothetical protein